MPYMFLLYKDPSLPEPPYTMQQHGAVETKAKGRRGYIVSAGLDESNTATTVRVRQAKPPVTDGPYAETKEVDFRGLR